MKFLRNKFVVSAHVFLFFNISVYSIIQVPSFTNPFNVYWQALFPFLNCTFHTTRNVSSSNYLSWQKLYNSVLSFCYEFGCVRLHTLYTWNISEKMKSMENSEYKIATILYPHVFRNQKFHKVCRIKFPALFLTDFASGANKVIKVLQFYHEENYRKRVPTTNTYIEAYERIYGPTFIIIPISKEITFDNMRIILAVPYYTNWKGILLYEHRPEIYMVKAFEKTYFRKYSYFLTVRVISSTESFHGLVNIVMNPNINLRKPGKNTYEDISILDDCPYENFFVAAKRTQDTSDYYRHFLTSHCYQTFFLAYVNGTLIQNQIIDHSYEFQPTEDIVQNSLFVISYGAKPYGIQYSSFVKRDRNFNIFSLLSPFSATGWIILFSTFGCLSLTLWITGYNYVAPHFGLLASLIEQDVYISDNFKTKNVTFILIAMWLLSAILIRNSYTSNLYSYLTIDSEPRNIPSSFNDLLFDKKEFSILASKSSIAELRSYAFSVRDVLDKHKLFNSTSIYKVLNTLYDKVWILDSISCLLEQENMETAKFLGKYCYDISSVFEFQNLFNRSRNRPALQLDRFGHVYLSGPKDSQKIQEDLTAKLILSASQQYRMFDTGEQQKYLKSFIWASELYTYFHETFKRTLAYIQESGIDGLQTRYNIQINMIGFIKLRFPGEHIKVKDTLIKRKHVISSISRWLSLGCFDL